MTDDVEETLASLEQRLRTLQAELDAEEDEQPPAIEDPLEEARRFPRAERVAPSRPSPPPAELATDPLERFGVELRRLVALWEQTVAELRAPTADAMTFRGGVALQAQGELPDLCALDRALRDVDGVAAVTMRAYAGGAAALEVGLDREVALIAELRRSLSFDLVEVSGSRVTIALS